MSWVSWNRKFFMFGLWKTFFFGAPKILLLIGDSYFWGFILGSPKSVQIPGKVNHSLAPLMIEVIDLGRKCRFLVLQNPYPYRWFIFLKMILVAKILLLIGDSYFLGSLFGHFWVDQNEDFWVRAPIYTLSDTHTPPHQTKSRTLGVDCWDSQGICRYNGR